MAAVFIGFLSFKNNNFSEIRKKSYFKRWYSVNTNFTLDYCIGLDNRTNWHLQIIYWLHWTHVLLEVEAQDAVELVNGFLHIRPTDELFNEVHLPDIEILDRVKSIKAIGIGLGQS